jgi:predicted ArsR family transcriptional regulator
VSGGDRRAPSVSVSRRSVLDALKESGEATAEEVAERLSITLGGARQHLAALAEEGLVTVQEDRIPGGRGRPRLVYSLSARAEPLFPKTYDELTNEILSYVGAEDAGLLERVFSRRRDARIENARRRLARKRGLEGRVRELTAILDEDGYMAGYDRLDRDTYRIVEHNCAILSVAKQHPLACRSEIEFIQAALPGTTVERVSHIASGAHQCAYLVRRIPT